METEFRNKLKQASSFDMAKEFDRVGAQLRQENPEASIYEWAKLVSGALPQRVPMKAYEIALQAAASADPHERKIGGKLFSYLNFKTCLTVVDFYTIGTDIDAEERDELLQTAIVSTSESLTKMNPKYKFSQQVYYKVMEALARYIASKEGISLALTRSPKFPQLRTSITDILADGTARYDEQDLKILAADLSQGTKLAKEDIFDWLKARSQRVRLTEKNHPLIGEDEVVIDEVAGRELAARIRTVLSGLPYRQRLVIEGRFGFVDGREYTLGEMAEQLGFGSAEAVRQFEAKALMRFRYSSSSWIVVDDPRTGHPQRIYISLRDYCSLSSVGIFYGTRKVAQASGIQQLGDFFSASPQELTEEWVDSQVHLIWVLRKVYKYLRPLYRKSIGQLLPDSYKELELLNHVSDAAIYRDSSQALATLRLIESQIYQAIGRFHDLSWLEYGLSAIHKRQSIFVKAVEELAKVAYPGGGYSIEPKIAPEAPTVKAEDTKAFLWFHSISTQATRALADSGFTLGSLAKIEDRELLRLVGYDEPSFREIKRVLSNWFGA